MITLHYQQPPQTGQNFLLAVDSTARPVMTRWFVDGNREQELVCPDPPCYQQMFIRRDWDGSQLLIVATDRDDRKELLFRIRSSDLSPQMPAGI